MPSFGFYEITLPDVCTVGVPMSDKIVMDALDHDDEDSKKYIRVRLVALAAANKVTIDPSTIKVREDLRIHRRRAAYYTDYGPIWTSGQLILS